MARPKGKTTPAMDEAEAGFIFIPLGGSGEIGMNLNLYACASGVECVIRI